MALGKLMPASILAFGLIATTCMTGTTAAGVVSANIGDIPPPCNGRGVPYFRGSQGACLCTCGYDGQYCEDDTNADSSCAFQGATWDDLAPCQTAGTTSNCGKGMFCARWKDPINAARCTCILRNDGRESPMCKKWLDSYLQATTPPIDGILPGPVITTVVTTTVTGTSGPQPTGGGGSTCKCPSGTECDKADSSLCRCSAFSTNTDYCGCPGSFTDYNDPNKTVSCAVNSDGFCTDVNDSSYSCTPPFRQILPASPADNVCPPGKTLQNGVCVCVPLSTNPDCLPKPVARVCGQFKTFPPCKFPISVSYQVVDGTRQVLSGSTSVSPSKNFFYSPAGLVTGKSYKVCVNTPPGFVMVKSKCSSYDSKRCCNIAKASTASTSSASGCAQFGQSFYKAGC